MPPPLKLNADSASTSTFVTALVFNGFLFILELVVFTLIRPYLKAIYEPRAYIFPAEQRTKPLSTKFFLWPSAIFKADYRTIPQVNGMDAYFFVRFLRMMVKIFLPIWIISWIVLLPINSIHTNVPGLDSLDKLTFGNVAPNKPGRYSAHVILVLIFTFWIFYIIKIEMAHFLIMRQKHLIEREHAKSVQASTILITGIPSKYLTYEAIHKLYAQLPGGIRRIWINRNLKELPDLYDRRMLACSKLEAAETKFMATAAKLRQKNGTAFSVTDSEKGDLEHAATHDASTFVPREQRPHHRLGVIPFVGKKVDTIEWCREEIATCSRLLEQGRSRLYTADNHDRNMSTAVDVDDPLSNDSDSEHHDGLGRVAIPKETVDAVRSIRVNDIKHAAVGAVDAVKGRVGALNANDIKGAAAGAVGAVKERMVNINVNDIKDAAVGAVGAVKGRVGNINVNDIRGAAVGAVGVVKGKVGNLIGAGGDPDVYPPLSSAFVTFNRQIAAHMAAQTLAHHEPYRMSSKYVEVAPEDVIWANLGMNPYEHKIRLAISYAMTAGLVIFWAFPIAVIGAVSNFEALCDKKWLHWICKVHGPVKGIIEGILPPVLLAMLMMILPIILRLLARFEGIPKKTGLELSLMTRFFIFQVVHSFLLITLSSGIIASLSDLLENGPIYIPVILAENLPLASTFFLTYFLLQGLAGTAGGFLRVLDLLIYYIKLFILGTTPREIYTIKYGAREVAWGTLFPGVTLLVVIALGYSIISPLINGLACAAFFAFYQLYKYLFLWVYSQDKKADTGGLFFPKAIQHLFIGLYVQQVCLCALFFLAQDDHGKPVAVGEGAVMVVVIILTAGYNFIIDHSYGPLLHALPLSLADKTYTRGLPESEDLDSPTPESAMLQDAQTLPFSGVQSGERTTPDEEALAPQDAQQREEEEKEAEYGYAHPAASRPQRIVWIPKDELGLSDELIRANRDSGVEGSVRNAAMNAKGEVDVDGPPPDLIGV